MLFALDGPRATLLWWTLPAYMTLIGAAVLLSVALLVWLTRGTWRARQAVDSALLALALGLVFGRVGHVLADWPYFSTAGAEIFRLSAGGLSAHGAILGAALGGYLSARRFGVPYGAWLKAAALALPLIALAAWWGCAAAGCAYGLEVANLSDHPPWLVWEAAGDFALVAPRHAVQPMGVWASLLQLIAAAGLVARGWSGWRVAGLSLAGVMLTSLALGLLRGDTAAYRLQSGVFWLDILLLVIGAGMAVMCRSTGERPA